MTLIGSLLSGGLSGSFIAAPYQPLNPPIWTVWVNTETGAFLIWNGVEWLPLNIDVAVYGTGTNGDTTISSNTNLDPTTTWNFKNFSLNASTTLSVSSVNSPLILLCQGDATINGTIDLNSKGGAKGAGSTGGNTATAGTAGNGISSAFVNAGGAAAGDSNGANSAGGGGGGASTFANGTIGSQGAASPTHGAGGTKIDASLFTILSHFQRAAVCGGGGGGGGYGSTGPNNGGDGGRGGGCLIMFINGNLTFGAASVIQADGETGAGTGGGGNGAGASGGGGGGGGGGILIFVKGTVTNAGLTKSAAAGGHNGNSGGPIGGDGAAGKVFIYSIGSGTVISA